MNPFLFDPQQVNWSLWEHSSVVWMSNCYCLFHRSSHTFGLELRQITGEKTLTPSKKDRLPSNLGLKATETDDWTSTSSSSSTGCVASLKRLLPPWNEWTLEMWASGFVSAFPAPAAVPLWTTRTLKARPLDSSCPTGAFWGPSGPALLCDRVSAAWSDATPRHHYPHHCASLPLCTGKTSFDSHESSLQTPPPLQPAAIETVLKSTTITHRPLDYWCYMNTNVSRFTLFFCFCFQISNQSQPNIFAPFKDKKKMLLGYVQTLLLPLSWWVAQKNPDVSLFSAVDC